MRKENWLSAGIIHNLRVEWLISKRQIGFYGRERSRETSARRLLTKEEGVRKGNPP